ncbi:MAG: N-6 DNA methylase [Candidatus Nitrosoabyssus spongiisocia]|nr:MAG: N-6 DNA methylase [Nitrosopumilaceae archaeon AB1(1)]
MNQFNSTIQKQRNYKSQINMKALGQYFTPEFLTEQMTSMISKSKNSAILEPSAGKGIFLTTLQSKGFQNICGVEIDNTLTNESNVDIIYENFLTWKPPKKYDVVIGNPPYIRWKNLPQNIRNELKEMKLCNGLMDILHAFILKAIDVLTDDGEMILITPDYWLRTLHTKKLREIMMEKGHIEKIIMYGEKPIFKNVASSIMIFKFVKNHSKSKFTVVDMTEKIQYKQKQFTDSSIWSMFPFSISKQIDRDQKQQ